RRGGIGIELLGRVPRDAGDRAADELEARRLDPVAEDDVGRAVDQAQEIALPERSRTVKLPRTDTLSHRRPTHPRIRTARAGPRHRPIRMIELRADVPAGACRARPDASRIFTFRS